jgi:hypothetical protein
MNSKYVTCSCLGLVLNTIPIFEATKVNNENLKQYNLYPALNPKPSKHEDGE